MNNKPVLTNDNYFGQEASKYYMSTSQFKTFLECPARALAEINGDYKMEKQVFKEGHYFEACLIGGDVEELFLMQNPDMVSSKGPTKGNIKANFEKVQGAVEAFKRQEMFMNAIAQCDTQVIVTGELVGVPFKGCIDFLDPLKNGHDTKCVKDFKRVYSPAEGCTCDWYFAYGYHYQAAIYQALIKQMYGIESTQDILAVTKEPIPDVDYLCFSSEVLKNALEVVFEYAPTFQAMKEGREKAWRCEKCEYCKLTKELKEPRVVEMFQ